jgi:membrane-associated phospholipid phosphatase
MLTYPKKYSLFLIALLLISQFHVLAQVDTISARKDKPEAKVDTTLAKQVKAVFEADSIPAKPLSAIPPDERTRSIVPDKAYFKSLLTDSRDIAISPFRWNKYQWIAISGVTVLAAVFYTQDVNIQKVLQKNERPFFGSVSTYGLEPWGSGLYTLPALGILYGVGAIVKNDKARYTALKGGEAYLLSFITGQILKQLTHRHRPYADNPSNPYLWNGPFQPISNSSFPSGHSMIAFAVATVVATSYHQTVWGPLICYSLAGLVAASRVYQNDHWFSDVFVGAALGFAIGKTIMNNHIKKLKVLPISHVGTGVMLVYQLD